MFKGLLSCPTSRVLRSRHCPKVAATGSRSVGFPQNRRQVSTALVGICSWEPRGAQVASKQNVLVRSSARCFNRGIFPVTATRTHSKHQVVKASPRHPAPPFQQQVWWCAQVFLLFYHHQEPSGCKGGAPRRMWHRMIPASFISEQ